MAQNFSSRVTNIRAGVIVLEADNVTAAPHNTAPFTWLNLERSGGFLPAGWTLDNPHAPGTASSSTLARWSTLIPSLGGAPAPLFGDRITRNEAPYWEVPLGGVTDDQLSNYDVLLVAPNSNVQLNPGERDKLRKFVDQGGVLWVDYGATQNPVDLINNFPVAVRLESVPGNLNQQSDFTQAILSRPYGLSASDMGSLNTAVANPWLMGEVSSSNLTLPTLYASLRAESYLRLQSVAKVGPTFDSVSLGRIGDGFICFTSRGIAHKLNETTTRDSNGRYIVNPNRGYRAGDTRLSARGVIAAKFAVNLLSLSNTYRQQNGGSRRGGSLASNIVAPLALSFSTTAGVASPNPAPNSQPVIYKGVMVVLAADGRLYAYDTNPVQDLDGDGNPDDGFPDYNTGAPYDLIWRSRPLSLPASSPTAVTIENPLITLQGKDQVLVTERNGAVSSFPLLPRVASTGYLRTDGTMQNLGHDFQVTPPNGTSVVLGGIVPAPTVHEGQVYVADNATNNGATRGRIWAFDLATATRISSTTNFALGGAGSRVVLPQTSFAPTIGYVPIQDNSGGYDRLMYYPTLPVGTNVNNAAGVASVWIGARGERPSDVTVDSASNRLLVSTRASSQGGLPVFTPGAGSPFVGLAPRITVIDAAGNPWTQVQMNAFFTDSVPMNMDAGVIAFQLRAGVTWPSNVSIRVDYTIDWGAGNVEELTGALRGTINLPDNSNNRRITGAIAMGPNGTLFLNSTGSIAGDGGSFYAIREVGRGIFKCLIRYEMHDAYNFATDSGNVQQEPVVLDVDNVNDYVPSANDADRRLRGFLLRGSPVVRNGQVFVTAQASKFITVPVVGRVPVPVAVLFAFNANPSAPEVPVGRFANGSVIVQPDLARSNAISTGGVKTPDTFSVLNSNFEVDRTRGVLVFDSLFGNDRGATQNSVSLSQPVLIKSPDGASRLIQPESLGGKWSPLNWYTTAIGLTLPTSANTLLVAGSTVYVVGNSVVPSLLSSNSLLETGVVTAYDSEISANDPTLRSPSSRLWQKQLVQDLQPGIANFEGNRHVRWPLLNGLTSFSSFVVRLNQTRLKGSSSGLGVVAGDGTLVAWGAAGVYAFADANLIVCDQNRIGLYDPAGDALKTFDAVLASSTSDDVITSKPTPLSRPTRSYALDNGEFLVVDAASNFVSRIDQSGIARRTIREFLVDPAIVPEGFNANAAKTLASPRDAATWNEVVALGTNPVFTNQQPVEYWVSTLIADSGNKRIVHLVDRYGYDVASNRVLEPIKINNVAQLGVLRWHSPASVSGGEFSYNSLSRVYMPSAGSVPARYVYVAGIGNALPTSSGLGLDTVTGTEPVTTSGGNGGVVLMDPTDSRFVRVINRISVPDLTNTPMWFDAADGSGQFVTAAALGDARLINARSAGERFISNLTSATARVELIAGVPSLMIMIADANGVYEFPVAATGSIGGVTWAMPRDVFRAVRPIFGRASGNPEDTNPENFRPMYAKRLASGEVLIVNGYLGRRRNGSPYYGEVVQIDGSLYSQSAENLGFRISSISYELGPIQGTRGLVQPIFADRR
jgi:hypothetical protein